MKEYRELTPFEQGVRTAEAGMNIAANPYRNTSLDEHRDAWSEWNRGHQSVTK